VPEYFDLEVAAGLANANAIVLTETGEEHDALLEHPVPAVTAGELQRLILAGRPFAEENLARVLPTKQGTQSVLEGTPEQHHRPVVLLLPAL
jgi:hypothetical protein